MPSHDRHPVTCTAHAGALNTPPNTAASILAGLRCVEGLGIIEVDLRFSPKGTPVLAHDPVEDESACTLEECFALAKNFTAQINLDLKEAQKGAHTLAEVRRLAEASGMLNRVFFTGVRAKHVPAVRGLGIPYYLNVYPNPLFARLPAAMGRLAKKARALGAVGLNLPHQSTAPALVKAARDAGLLVSTWTAEDQADMRRLLALGVDNITTRSPDVLIRIMKELT